MALTIMREKVTPNMVLVDDALTDEVRRGGRLSHRGGLWMHRSCVVGGGGGGVELSTPLPRPP